MKKTFVVPFVALLICSCSNQHPTVESSEIPSESHIETTFSQEPETISEQTVSSAEMIEVPNTEELSSLINSTLSSSNIDDVDEVFIDQSISSDSDMISIDTGIISLAVAVKTESHNLIVDCQYVEMIDSWSVNSIKDADTGNCYYSYDGGRFVDMYDYNTDQLISESTENIETLDPVSEFNEQAESIDAEFDAGLESLAEKYGLE